MIRDGFAIDVVFASQCTVVGLCSAAGFSNGLLKTFFARRAFSVCWSHSFPAKRTICPCLLI